jgi:hypothetical protein
MCDSRESRWAKECGAVHEVAEIPVFFAILRELGVKVRIGNRLGYLMDQMVHDCVLPMPPLGLVVSP